MHDRPIEPYSSAGDALMSPAEILAAQAEIDSDPERFKAEMDAFCAAASLKADQMLKRNNSPR